MEISLGQLLATTTEDARDAAALLGSKALIARLIDDDPAITCDAVLPKLLQSLEGWNDENAQTDPEAAVRLGWLHLFFELCKQQKPGEGKKCEDCPAAQQLAEDDAGARLAPLLRLFLAIHDKTLAKVSKVITGAADGVLISPETWKERYDYWSNPLIPKDASSPATPILAETDVGQAIVMHLLEVLLPLYREETSIRKRCNLNILLVPLIRALFRHPDRAHFTYTRYFHGSGRDDACPFHMLYGKELGMLEEFQSRGIRKRVEVFREIREVVGMSSQAQPSAQSVAPLPPVLRKRANAIIHAVEDQTPSTTTPRPKRNRLGQLTCLIREISTSEAANRAYRPVLDGIPYRRAELKSGMEDHAPGVLDWKVTQDSAKGSPGRLEIFQAAVKARYSSGYDTRFLHDLFDDPDTDSSNRTSIPAWIQDGEITFLALVTALTLAGDSAEWISGNRKDDIKLTWENITKTKDASGFSSHISLGESLEHFSKKLFMLFDATGVPLPRFWSLINFLQRAARQGRPTRYAPRKKIHGNGDAQQPLGQFAKCLYDELEQSDTASLEILQETLNKCAATLHAGVPSNQDALTWIEQQSRLPTFTLELILRQGEIAPYSLFFYPLSFDAVLDDQKNSLSVPTAFLAGTYVGLEWGHYPSVTTRHNYHLICLVDALRPLVDFEIGRVLAHDQDQFRKSSQKEAEAAKQVEIEALQWAKQSEIAALRERQVNAIMPAVRELSDLFTKARGFVYRVQTAVDPDWGGLFSREASEVFGKLFESRARIAITHHVDPEPKSFQANHEISLKDNADKRLFYSRLIYLARDVEGYSATDALGDANWFTFSSRTETSHEKLFEHAPVLRAFVDCALADPTKASHLNILLKLLTADAADPVRGIHVIQVVAALSMLSRNLQVTAKRISVVRGSDDSQDHDFKGWSLKPVKGDGKLGIDALVELLKFLMGNTIPTSTSDIPGGVRLAGLVVEPFVFLRALAILCSEVFAGIQTDRLSIVDWKVIWTAGNATEAKPATMELHVHCNGSFNADVKAGLWDYHTGNETTYHNLRSNFRTLCAATGSFPVFMELIEDPHSHVCELSSSRPFLIIEGLKDSSRASSIRLLLGACDKKPISNIS